MKNPIVKDILITFIILVFAFFISVVFQNNFGIEEHVSTLFAFAVFLISLFTTDISTESLRHLSALLR